MHVVQPEVAFSFSIGGLISDVDARLTALQPIWEFSRLPRSLEARKYSEWRSWLLFFSPVVLCNLLPSVYYRNWLKFVKLTHFLLAQSIPLDKLRKVRKEMRSFLKEYEELYEKQNMTYDAHLLIHLADSAEVWGPLWNYSAFPFEDMNGQLVRLITGTRHAHLQVIEKFSFLASLPRIWQSCSYSKMDPSVQKLMNFYLKGYHLKTHSLTVSSVLYHGKGTVCPQVISYNKVTINGLTCYISTLDKSRRLNSYIEVDGVFRRLQRITLSCMLYVCMMLAVVREI